MTETGTSKRISSSNTLIRSEGSFFREGVVVCTTFLRAEFQKAARRVKDARDPGLLLCDRNGKSFFAGEREEAKEEWSRQGAQKSESLEYDDGRVDDQVSFLSND